MKKITLLFFLCSLNLFGQDSLTNPSKWTIAIEGAIQEHDKRLFKYSERQTLWDMHPEFFGTYQMAIRADRIFKGKGVISWSIGTGLSTELNTFTRPFNHIGGNNASQFEILLHTNRYYKNLLQVPIGFHVPIGRNTRFLLEALPQFNFLIIADYANIGESPHFPVLWWEFNFQSIEINPSLIWTKNKFDFGLKYRIAQVKRIDPIIFNRIIKDPRTDQNFELDNPFKLWFSMGYRL